MTLLSAAVPNTSITAPSVRTVSSDRAIVTKPTFALTSAFAPVAPDCWLITQSWINSLPSVAVWLLWTATAPSAVGASMRHPETITVCCFVELSMSEPERKRSDRMIWLLKRLSVPVMATVIWPVSAVASMQRSLCRVPLIIKPAFVLIVKPVAKLPGPTSITHAVPVAVARATAAPTVSSGELAAPSFVSKPCLDT